MTDHRTQAESLFDSYTGTYGTPGCKWSPSVQMVKNVFCAFPMRAFQVDQVDQVARAVDSLAAGCTLEETLTVLTRARVLRSRRHQGRKLYEVNFGG